MTLQYIRPDADSVDGTWLNASGNNTDLFDSLNETSFCDADYIKSSLTAGDVVRLRLSDPNAALASPAVIRVRCKREGTDAIDLTVRLKEGTTVIGTWEYAFVTDSFVTIEETLTGTQIAAITDPTNLFVELESGISTHRGAAVD